MNKIKQFLNVKLTHCITYCILFAVLVGLGSLTSCSRREVRYREPYRTPEVTKPSAEKETPTRVIQKEKMGTFGIIPRSQWTMARIADPTNANPMGRITNITIHHDGMPLLKLDSVEMVRYRISAIRFSHINQNRWADIAYHYIVDPFGNIWEGRPIQYQGAHVQNYNEGNIGILMLGNFEIEHPTDQAMSSLYQLVDYLAKRYQIDLDRVNTHIELAFKGQCPGINLQSRIMKARLSGGPLAKP